MSRRKQEDTAMEATDVATLVEIVTDPEGAEEALSPEERQAYEDARRSVVEARFITEPPEGTIRIL